MSKMLLFALPSIGMQIVDNTYQVADGYFISNFISEDAFAAENLIFPPLLIVMSVGLMFGSGASALISKELGAGNREKANKILSMITAVLAAAGVILSAALYFLAPDISRWVGASEELVADCVTYSRMLAFFMPFQMLSMAFHPLLIAAERPTLGLITTISNAAANIFLDWLFVAKFGWGMWGAALATGLAWLISAVIPMIFFLNKKHPLHFVAVKQDLKALVAAVYNGSSEMVDAISYAIVALIFNLQLIRYLGNNGVSAYAVSEYMGGLFMAIFYGISMSIVPVAGYHLGQKNVDEIHSLRRNGLILTGIFGIAMTCLCIALADPISRIFVGYNESLTTLAIRALRLTSLAYLLSGMTTYSSSYFTGLNQGTASLAIAAVKGFGGPLLLIYLLPRLIGSDGLWLANPGAEVLATAVAIGCHIWWLKRGERKALEAVGTEQA